MCHCLKTESKDYGLLLFIFLNLYQQINVIHMGLLLFKQIFSHSKMTKSSIFISPSGV